MLGRDPMCSCPANKRTRSKAQFPPTENSWARRSENCTAKGFLVPAQHDQQAGGYAKWRVQDCVYYEGSGLGIRQERVEHMRSFTTRQNPFPWQNSNLWKRKDVPSPHHLEDCKHYIQWGNSAEQAGQAQEPPAGCISTEEKPEENLQKDPV